MKNRGDELSRSSLQRAEQRAAINPWDQQDRGRAGGHGSASATALAIPAKANAAASEISGRAAMRVILISSRSIVLLFFRAGNYVADPLISAVQR
jgi:hypothetical protein